MAGQLAHRFQPAFGAYFSQHCVQILLGNHLALRLNCELF